MSAIVKLASLLFNAVICLISSYSNFNLCKFLRLRSDLTKSVEEAIVASLAFLVGMEEVGGGGGGGGPEGAIRMPFLGGGWGAGGIITPWVSK